MIKYFFISLGVLVVVWVAAIIYSQIEETVWDEKNPHEHNNNPYVYDRGFHQAMWLIVAGMILIFCGVVLHGERDQFEKKTPTDIIAASNSMQTNARFYLLGGTIDSSPAYFYFTEQSDGGIIQHSKPASRSTIYQGDYDPHVMMVEQCWGEVSFLVAETCSSPSSQYNPRRYEFYVPEGSVSTDFNFTPGG